MKAPKMQIKVDLKSQSQTKPPQQKLPPPPRRQYKEKPKVQPVPIEPPKQQKKNATEVQQPKKIEQPPQEISIIKEEKPKEITQEDDLRKMIKVKSNDEIQSEVKKWKLLSETLQKKRQIEFELFKKKMQFEKEQQMKQTKQKQQAEQQSKRQQIKKRLEQISQRKQKRTEELQAERRNRLRAASEEKKQPLYQEKQKQFHMKKLVEQAQIKENIMKKKQEMMIDIEELKQHEQKFINHLKQRFKKNHKNNSKPKDKSSGKQGQGHAKTDQMSEGNPSIKNHKSQFNLYIGGDPVQKQKDLQKYVRRKKFEEKVKKIPIFIDQQKMKQALIAKDKAKNPLKYNYLSNVAALSDEKIYQEFKDFQININKKQLGNDYMREIHQKIPITSRIRSQSESRLKPPQKPQYKNYMPQVKSMLKRRIDQKTGKPNDQVQQILYKYDNNSDRLAQLNKKSDYYKNQVLKKIMQIRSTSPTTAYTDYLGKEKNIDDLYMKSIKMKIATAQISS